MEEPFDLAAFEKLDPVLTVHCDAGDLRFSVINSTTEWRVKTLFSKEPETIAWINSFEEGANFVDIGANMGIYSIYAAVARKANVRSFEPEAENFRLLQKNIYLNNLFEQITAWPAALFDEAKFSVLYLSGQAAAGSDHNFDQSVNSELEPITRPRKQGAISTTLDILVNNEVINTPHHIKIDVDGFEHKILRGAANLLKNKQLRSILVELNWDLDVHSELLSYMESFGFKVDFKQIKASQKHMGECNKFAEVGNCIFYRE